MGGICETATLEDMPPDAAATGDNIEETAENTATGDNIEETAENTATETAEQPREPEQALWEQFPGCCTAQHMQDEVKFANSQPEERVDNFAGDPELENLEAEFEARFASQNGIFNELEQQNSQEDLNGVELLPVRRSNRTKSTVSSTRSSASSETLPTTQSDMEKVAVPSAYFRHKLFSSSV